MRAPGAHSSKYGTLIGFLVNTSPLLLFNVKLKLISSITCIYIKFRCTYPGQFKYESRKTRFEENYKTKLQYEITRDMYKFSLKNNV